MVGERVVLLRIEHLQQRRRRVAAKVGPQLVDLVEHKDRIVATRLAQPLYDAPRQRPDIGAAMTADLRFVAHATERNAHELAPQCACYRPAQRSFADARRADKAQDWPLHIAAQFAHGQVFEHPLLYLGQPIVVFVEYLRSRGNIQTVIGGDGPGQLHQPIQVGAHDGILGRTLLHLLHALELARGRHHRLLRQLGLFERGAQFVDLCHHRVGTAELFLNVAQLFAQKILALRFAQLLLHLRLNAVAHLEDFHLARQEFRQTLQALLYIERLENVLMFAQL